MSRFTAKPIDLNTINGGKRFVKGDTPSPNTFNDPIEASAYAQGIATNQPNILNLTAEITPSVYIEETLDGSPRLVFEGLKGQKGASFRVRGFWEQGNSYYNNQNYIDCVYYDGSTFACTQTETNSLIPPPTSPNWTTLVSGTTINLEGFIAEEDLTIKEFE